VPKYLGHDYLLTWCHRELFKDLVLSFTNPYSHFLHLEDDINIGISNVRYWMFYRELLEPYNLIPGFHFYETLRAKKYSLYQTNQSKLERVPFIRLEDYFFVNLPNPYQPMYFLDVTLMKEWISSPAYSPEYGPWGIREKANQALTFWNVPQDMSSRVVFPFTRFLKPLPESEILHASNNYSMDKSSPYGKILLENILISP
jgi:hypothetical protein